MRLPKPTVLLTILLLVIAPMAAPGTGLAGDDNGNDNTKKNDKPESSRQTSDKPTNDKPASDKPTTAKPESSPQTIVPAGGKPDLVLTCGGLKSPDNRRVIAFTVKNIGTAPSSATTMVGVTTSTPEPTPNYRQIPLPPKVGTLKPGESGVLQPGESAEVIYSLAADCNGHRVGAAVNEPLDSNPANNFILDQLVCPIVPPEADIIVGPSPRVIELPEQLRKGHHDWPEYPSVLRRHGIMRRNLGVIPHCFRDLYRDRPFSIGFEYMDEWGCNTNTVYQLIVDFDLTWLHDVNLKLISSVELMYEEEIVFEHFNDPEAEAVNQTCIGQLGLAPANWPEIVARRNSPDSLTPALLPLDWLDVPHTFRVDLTRENRSYASWDVTREIQQKVAGQEFHGFVLHPSDASLDAESDSGCLSHLDKLRLVLHYDIL